MDQDVHDKPFPHLALSGQCIVDCQQCAVGSSPVVGLRRLHVSVDTDVGLVTGDDLHAAAPQLELRLLCEAFYHQRIIS